VVFPGAVKRHDIAAHIAAMDIAVQPRPPEYACPMKILEYIGMGKCTVAPDQPNIRESLDDGITGLLFKRGQGQPECRIVEAPTGSRAT
jgi:glycosyltransferase involved in cell wall biosynthesis